LSFSSGQDIIKFPTERQAYVSGKLIDQSLIMKWILILSLSSICCNDKNASPDQSKVDSATTVKPKKEFRFSSVSLFTIDPTFYNQPDTIVDFPNGQHACEDFFHGSAFIDSTGKPIHDQYKKYDLDSSEVTILKGQFLSDLGSSERKMCMTTYRDVLIFYDSSKKVLVHAPICFGCSEVLIYPRMEEICDNPPNLDFKQFKQFVTSIKSK